MKKNDKNKNNNNNKQEFVMTQSRVEELLKDISFIHEDTEPAIKTYLSLKANTYIVQVSMHLHDEAGNTKRFRKTLSLGTDNKNKAMRLVVDIESKLQSEIHKRYESMFFHDFITTMEKWLEVKKTKIDIITYEGYYNRFKAIKRYFEPFHLSVEEVRPIHITRYIEWALENGRVKPDKNGSRKLANKTVREYHSLIKMFFSDAVKYNVINISPCAETCVERERPDTTGNSDIKEDLWLDRKMTKRFVNWLETNENSIFHKLALIVDMTVYYGMRREEILALRWDVMDFENHVFKIKRTVVKNNKTYYKDSVKSKASRREYPLLDDFADQLKLIKQKQEIMRATDKNYKDGDFVFTWDDGRPISPDYLRILFKKAVKQCEFLDDRLHFHLLRHSTVSILADEGWELQHIQDWVGHEYGSDVTARIYLHKKESWKQAKLAELNELRKKEQSEMSI